MEPKITQEISAMTKRAGVGLAAFALTIMVMIPLLFFLSRKAVSADQYFIIVTGVLLLVFWTIPYATLVDPLLRRGVGSLLNVNIQWRGPSSSIAWTPVEETGCLLSLFIDLLGYVFIALWFVPFAAVIGLVLWLRH
jgi:hypothetical protein